MRKLCAICGVRQATTKDHIPPQSLYPKPRDNDINLNTVPACSICNNGSSTDDEIFKVLIGITTGEYQSEPNKIIESLASTIGTNQKIANQIFETKQHVYAQLNGNIYEPATAVTFDHEAYDRVITRIIKGLYWMENGSALPEHSKIIILVGEHLKVSVAQSLMSLMHELPLRKLNKESFLYRFHITE